eukprot:scaffold3695_cov19-Tisochrysis_lutea.AAC.2
MAHTHNLVVCDAPARQSHAPGTRSVAHGITRDPKKACSPVSWLFLDGEIDMCMPLRLGSGSPLAGHGDQVWRSRGRGFGCAPSTPGFTAAVPHTLPALLLLLCTGML